MSAPANARDRRPPRGAAAGLDPFRVPTHHFAQLWLLFVSLAAFALAVLDAEALLVPVFALDRSHVTALIAALVLAGTVHAAWHVLRYSRRIEAARTALEGTSALDGERDADVAFVAAWARDARASRARPGDDGGGAAGADDLIELYADRLRSPVDLGWFLVDVTVRLGLLGTIIGFILIFGSLDGVSIDGAEGLRELLVAMSGGMGTALFTTLAGLVGATLLSVQYLIVGRAAEHLLGSLVRYRAGLGETAAVRDDDTVGALAGAALERDRRSAGDARARPDVRDGHPGKARDGTLDDSIDGGASGTGDGG